jgi:hypothetical protein
MITGKLLFILIRRQLKFTIDPLGAAPRQLESTGLLPAGKTYAMRIGRGRTGGEIEPDKREFVIDFVGDHL